MRPPVLAALVLILAGCGAGSQAPDELAALDRELAAAAGTDPARDPLVAAALHDPIMVDPTLAHQSNADAIRPPNRPDTGAVAPIETAARPDPAIPTGLERAPAPTASCPECRARAGALTLGMLAERAPDARVRACAGRIGYSYAWAANLPPAAAMFPDARVVEAAGADGAGCSLRVVSYRSSAPLARVADWHHTQAKRAGMATTHRAEGGTHAIGGAGLVALLRARAGGGTDVDLVAGGG